MTDKNAVSDWDTTPDNNDNIAGLPLGENLMYPRHVNNALRNMMAQIKTAIGVSFQAFNANLAAIAGLTSAADKLPYFTGSGTAATTTFTAAGRALVDDADAAAQRTTLGLDTMATQSAGAVAITGGAIAGITDLAIADGGTGASTAAAARTNLGAIGGSTGSTDNRLLRSDGTGGATVQGSAITVDDSGNMSGVAGITMSGGVTAGASAAFVTSVTTNLVSASATIVPTLIMQRGRGSGAPGAVQSGDGLGGCLWAPHDGTNYGSPNTAAFFAYAEENFSTSAHGSRIAFETTPTGSTTRGERLRIGQGVYHASATGGDKGNNTINFGAVYDDNTLLTCAALSEEFISQGTIDLDYWDSLVPDQVVPEKRDLVPQTYSLERQRKVARDVPDDSGRLIRRVEVVTEVEEVPAFIADPVFDETGNIVDGAPTYLYDEVVTPAQTIKRQHRTARIFKAMLDAGFDPRDPEQYFARMAADQALPGMPTRGDGPLKWEHNSLSLGELASQKWLAMEMLAIVCNAMWLKLKDHEARIAALETATN